MKTMCKYLYLARNSSQSKILFEMAPEPYRLYLLDYQQSQKDAEGLNDTG